MLHLALYQPAIPQNTGNIGRLCVGMGAHLHIIRPTVFDLSDKALKRAGLDYWPYLTHTIHEDAEAFLSWLNARSEERTSGGDEGRDGPDMPTSVGTPEAGDTSGGGAHNPTPWLITKHGNYRFDQAPYRNGDVLIMGNENTGLPEAWHTRWPDRRIYIPMPGNTLSGGGGIRSYNLANAAAMVLGTATMRVLDPK